MLLVAIGARAIAVVQAWRAPFWSTPVMDESAYMRLADAMVKGLAPPNGAYYQAPGYGYFLAAIHAFGGTVVQVKLIQVVLGILNSLLVWKLARRCIGGREAVLAGVLWAVYPIALFHEVLLLKPTLAVCMCLAALVVMPEPYSAVAGAEQRARTSWHGILRGAATGFLLGLAAVIQAELAGVALMLGSAAILRAAPKPRTSPRKPLPAPRRWRPPAAAAIAWSTGAAAFAFVLAIPTFQNSARGGGRVVVAYGGGTNFYIGNHPGADGSYVPLRSFRSDPALEESDAVELAAAALGHRPRPAEVSRYWWRRGVSWWRVEPGAALRLTLKKVALLWGPQEQADVLDSAMAARWMGILRNPVVSPAGVLPLALVGLWLTRRRREPWPARTFVLGSTLMIVPFFVFERFRLPMTPACMPFAAHTVFWLCGAFRTRRFLHAAGGVTAAAALGLGLSFAHVTRERTVMRANVGNMFLLRGRFAAALTEFEAVRAVRPAAWRVEIGIATAQAGLRQRDAALRTLDSVLGKLRAEERSTGRTPREELALCYALAGDLQREAGRPQEAARDYRSALELAPGRPDLTSKLRAAEAAADSTRDRAGGSGAVRASGGNR